MLKGQNIILILILISIIFSCTVTNKSNKNYEVEEISGVVYRTVEGIDLTLDIITPIDSNGSFPAILYVPGHYNQKSRNIFLHDERIRQSSRGYITISMNYRTDYYPPKGIYDIKTAIRWLQVNGDKYNIDKDNIAIFAKGEGSTRALVATLSGSDPEHEGDADFSGYSCKVQAIVNISGDLGVNDQRGINIRFGGSYDEYPEHYEIYNVINLVNKEMPPILSITGFSRDSMIEKTKELDAQMYYLDAEHIWIVREGFVSGDSLALFNQTLNPIDQFLDFHLKN